MKKIGRPRKSVTKQNISVNLPKHLIAQINDALSWQQSRSIWIEDAIKDKLNRKLPDIDEYPLETLVWTAKNHKNAPKWLIKELSYYLETISKMQVGETEEGQ